MKRGRDGLRIYHRQIRHWKQLERHSYRVAAEMRPGCAFRVTISAPPESHSGPWMGTTEAGVYEAFDLANYSRILDEGGVLALTQLPDLCPTCGRGSVRAS